MDEERTNDVAASLISLLERLDLVGHFPTRRRSNLELPTVHGAKTRLDELVRRHLDGCAKGCKGLYTRVCIIEAGGFPPELDGPGVAEKAAVARHSGSPYERAMARISACRHG